MSMKLDELCDVIGIDTRPIAIYDAPDPDKFAPLVDIKRCIFESYDAWQEGDAGDHIRYGWLPWV